VRTRIGNIRGISGATEYGLFAGDVTDGGSISNANRYIRLTDTNFTLNNLDLNIYNGGNRVIALDYATPYFSMGATAPTSFLQLSSNGIWMGNAGSSVYKMRVGNVNSGGVLTAGYTWDGTTFAIVGNVTANNGNIGGWTIAGTGGPPATGGEIYNGAAHLVSSGTLGGAAGAYFGKSSSGWYGWVLTDGTKLIGAIANNAGIDPYIYFSDGSVYRLVLGGMNYSGWPGGAGTGYGMKIADHAGTLLVEFSGTAAAPKNMIANWTVTTGGFTSPTGVVVIGSGGASIPTPGAFFGKSTSTYYGFRLSDGTKQIAAWVGDSSIDPYMSFYDGTYFRVVLGGMNYSGFPGGASTGYGLKIGDSGNNLMAEFSNTRNYIAGWYVGAGYLFYDSGSNSAGMVPTDWPFYAGNTYVNRSIAPFRVSNTGAVTASAGSIGGWSLTSTKIYSTGIDILSGAGAAMAFGASPNTPTSATVGTGLWIDANGLSLMSSSQQLATVDPTNGVELLVSTAYANNRAFTFKYSG